MFFALLVLMSAFLIEGIGTYVSVVGLSALFASNPIIIILAISLDVGKVVSVSFLYKYWKKINWLMKSYMTIATIVLMVITSSGAFGYLSGQFQKAISGTNQDTVFLNAMTDEQGRLQSRKQEIDLQIAKLPDNVVAGRRALIRQFAPEVNQINKRLVEIDAKLPELKIESIKKNVEVGPIIYIAQAFNTDAEHAVKWVIFTIIFVFDPLAIALLLAGNFLIELRKKGKEIEKFGIIEPLIEKIIPTYSLSKEDIVKVSEEQPPITELKEIKPISAEDTELDVMLHLSDELLHKALGKTPALDNPTESHDHLSDDELHVDLGREKVIDNPTESHDHLSDDELHVDLGREKVANLKINEVLPNELDDLHRDIITMQHINKVPRFVKSSLEEVSDRSDVETDDQPHRGLSDLRAAYQDEDNKPAIISR